ncbi:MAG TPA: hypothetical protein VH500_24345 [Nitrososphaeraceae archaeon]|jgi:membrane protein implicated in regulation of membrane protease activity
MNAVAIIVLLILPPGTVKNEGVFFGMLSVLIALIVLAMILRRRRLRASDSSTD